MPEYARPIKTNGKYSNALAIYTHLINTNIITWLLAEWFLQPNTTALSLFKVSLFFLFAINQMPEILF